MKMAHFVAVCMFCVMSAGHLPCFAHNDHLIVQQVNPSVKNYSEIPNSYSEHSFSNHRIDSTDENTEKNDYIYNEVPTKSKDDEHQESTNNELPNRLGQVDVSNSRNKRSTEIDDKYFTKKIFDMFGDGENMTMDGFEKMLKKLGLFQQRSGAVSDEEIHRVDSNQSASRIANTKEITSHNGHPDAHKHEHSKQRCLSSVELLSALSDGQYDSISNSGKNNNNYSAPLPHWIFERVCPALIYQLTSADKNSKNCIKLVDDEETTQFEDNHTLVFTGHDHDIMATRNMFQVWVYSTVSILVISLCGLLGVAVIPVMGKSYYQQLLQFLVALAVGTLCGDALIHLLPHAMMSESAHSHTHVKMSNENEGLDAHTANMWKGFVAMIGLVMFFFTEKLLNMIAECRRNKENRRQIPAHVKVIREAENVNSNTVGEKLCKHRYQAYRYPYGEIATEAQDNLHQHNHHEKPQTIDEEKPLTCNSTNCVTVCNNLSMSNDVDKKKCNNEDWKLDDNVINDSKKAVVDGSDVPLNDPDSYAVIIRDHHEGKHHGHGHSHNHVHPSSDSITSVAWMVVLGDGLHNFTDGMAIGAAFSANIAGGFSTTIAVFCHELPHELGDFAVLLKSGMTAKQAVFYNLLSSVLCLFGMVFGVLLGTTPEASSWMFAAAAGMFIYIALVDMIPELSSSPTWRFGALWNMFLQTSGLITGFSIMLLIALYEHDLQHLFNS